MYLVKKLRKLLEKLTKPMKKPQLLKTDSNGGTIHSYQITGGLTTFDKYLACLKGRCEFNNTFKQAETYLENLT